MTGDPLAELKDLVPPPDDVGLGSLTWEELHEALGTALPSDYAALMRAYGASPPGAQGWLRFPDPLAPRGGLLDAWRRSAPGFQRFHLKHPDACPRPMFPEPGGMLFCADTIDGDQLGWVTEGAPDEWPVVVWPRHTDGIRELPGPLTSVLLRWWRGEVDLPGLSREAAAETRAQHAEHGVGPGRWSLPEPTSGATSAIVGWAESQGLRVTRAVD
ncbi:hypothetical protein JOF41_005726 [Saccharothrix coeruleofusca]|uniref:hypothetical protein n=1 Tax=Saccharothrix coeruleofusca TaxID=33919 RepID=UPI001AE23D77|nr:hypothetical protein [Saccharothrix coeruleofusca]MBP2339548.1 hypothetical protein [Saccharothrix coeruleofusca]